MAGQVLEPGGGERIALGPTSVTIKATSDDTAGAMYLGEVELAARRSALGLEARLGL